MINYYRVSVDYDGFSMETVIDLNKQFNWIVIVSSINDGLQIQILTNYKIL